MTPERLRQIEELFHSVREGAPEQRAALLAHADPELRREVESLLALRAGDLPLDRPAVEDATQLVLEPGSSKTSAGTLLGPYRIEGKLGEGGMGEVFRAVDTRLGRAVAIKIGHDRFSARFDREARAISSLNHPNICTLFDVGPNYLVMELVDGETLASRLKQGPLPVETALRYGAQMLAALAEAHARGIVHRDLKPGNVMLSKSGAKVLDFGLATLEGDVTLTSERMVLGTPAYMAPEQREGRPADARADLYAFGCVLYEMVAGARASVQRKPLPSRRLEKIVSRCLEEDADRRWQSAAELQQALSAMAPGTRTIRTTLAAAAATAVVAVSVAAAYVYLRPAPTLTDKDTIVVAEFTNTTGDPVFDETLRHGLAVQLEQSPFLSLLSDDRIRRTLALMDQQPDARLSPDVAREVCVRTASAAVLDGSIARLGSQYVVGLRATHCTTGDILADEQLQAARKEDVLSALSQIARRFRTRVGESLATVEKHSTPLEEATTPSLEALKAYSAAWKLGMSSGLLTARPLLERALAIDPELAIAHAYLGINYSYGGESTLARESTLRAYQLRERASDVERFFIDTMYDRQVTGNLEREQRTLESWAQTYPRDQRPHGLLAGFATRSTGQYELSIGEAEKSMALDSGGGPAPSFGSKAFSELYLNRLAAAKLTVQQATDRKLDYADFGLVRYFIGFLNGDVEAMNREAVLARSRRSTADMMSHVEALVLARSGRLQEARRMSANAVDIAKQSGQHERAALFEASTAVWEAFYGNAAAARQRATGALALARGREVDYAAAFALAVSGEVSRSRALADDLDKNFPEDTSVQYIYLPTLRALFSVKAQDAAAAIQSLQTASRLDLAVGGIGFNGFFGALHPIYVRGEAYRSAHRAAEAAAEFERILDHRSIVLVDPMDAMARLQLARALVLSGDIAKAKDAYRDLFALWKDADAKVPMVDEARAEYARLSRLR